MTKRISELYGLKAEDAEKLHQFGLKLATDLYHKSLESGAIEVISEHTGLDQSQLLNWAQMSDFFRIKGVGGQFAELLTASGITTMTQLAQCHPLRLYETLNRVNVDRSETRAIPNLEKIADFIKQAQEIV